MDIDVHNLLALEINKRPNVLFHDDVTLDLKVETIFDEVKNQETEAPIRVTVKMITQKIRRVEVREYDPEASFSDGIKALTDEVHPQEYYVTAEELVKKIAEQDPIHPNGGINECTFCHVSWAERGYEKYLENQTRIEAYRKAADTQEKRIAAANELYQIVNEHHEDDCLWVEANKVMKG